MESRRRVYDLFSGDGDGFYLLIRLRRVLREGMGRHEGGILAQEWQIIRNLG